MSGFFARLVDETQQDREALVGIPIIQSALLGAITRDQYVAFLGQAYHHVRHTTPLLMACGSRLSRETGCRERSRSTSRRKSATTSGS